MRKKPVGGKPGGRMEGLLQRFFNFFERSTRLTPYMGVEGHCSKANFVAEKDADETQCEHANPNPP